MNEPYYPDDTEFTDVDLKSEYYEAIKSMYLCGVMLGYEDGRFCPGGYIMRSEAAAMFCRLLGYWDGGYEFICDDISKQIGKVAMLEFVLMKKSLIWKIINSDMVKTLLLPKHTRYSKISWEVKMFQQSYL